MTKTPAVSPKENSDKGKYNVHKEVIIGSFVIGTLAFVVAHAWNSFFGNIVQAQIKSRTEKQEETNKFNGENNGDETSQRGAVFFYGMYALIITVIAVILVLILIQFDVLQHKPQGRFAQFRPKIGK